MPFRGSDPISPSSSIFFAILAFVSWEARASDALVQNQCEVVTAPASAGGSLMPRPTDSQSKELCDDCGTPMLYSAFDGEQFRVQRFDGRFVDLAVSEEFFSYPESSPQLMLRFLESAELLYQQFYDVVGEHPEGVGETVVAVLAIAPSEAQAFGRGLRGSRGIELYYAPPDGPEIPPDHFLRFESQSPHLDLIAHEFSHNFDIWYQQVSVPTEDPPHYWSYLFESIRFDNLTLQYRGFFDPAASPSEHARIWGLDRFVAMRKAGVSFDACVYGRECGDLNFDVGLGSSAPIENNIAATVFHRVVELRGEEVRRGFFRRLGSLASQSGAPTTAMDLQIEALSLAAGERLDCIAETLGHSFDATAAQRLGDAGLPVSPLCLDADRDGWTVFWGDSDDQDDQVHPLASEIPDGKDNDSNGIVDEPIIVFGDSPPTIALPAKIVGDSLRTFNINVEGTSRVMAKGCAVPDDSMGNLTFSSAGDQHDSTGGVSGTSGLRDGTCITRFIDLNPGANRVFALTDFRYQSGASGAPYSITLSAVEPSTPRSPPFVLWRSESGGTQYVHYRSIGSHPQDNEAGNTDHLWIAGEGVVASLPASPTGRFPLPPRLNDRILQARVLAQADDGTARRPPSNLQALHAPLPTTPINEEIAGTWYDPARSGEGWQVYVGEPDSAGTLVSVTFYTNRVDRNVTDSPPRAVWFLGATIVPELAGDFIDLPINSVRKTHAAFSNSFYPPVAVNEGMVRLEMLPTGQLHAILLSKDGQSLDLALSRVQDVPPASTAPINPSLGGLWHHPNFPGEGLLVEFGQVGTQPSVIVGWYTQCGVLLPDIEGPCFDQQHWLAGSGTYDSDGTSIGLDLFESKGSDFGLLLNPARATARSVGSLEMRWVDCNTLDISFKLTSGATKSARLSRFASDPVGLACN